MKGFFSLQIAILALGIAARAQVPIKGCPKVIYHSSELTDSGCDNNIKRVGLTFFSDKPVVKYRNGRKRRIPEDSLWGFRSRNDYPYRLYDDEYYRLYRLSPVYYYSKKYGKSIYYYFSNTPDSPIYPYSNKQLKLHTDSSTYAAIISRRDTNRHKWAIDLFGFNTNIAYNNFWGGGYNIRYYPGKKFSTGIRLAMSFRRVKDTYNFSVIEPVITNFEFAWINQYDLVQTGRFKMGVSLVSGVFLSQLADRAIQNWVYTSRGYRKVSKKIATNTFFLMEPGVDLAFRLFSNKHATDYFLTTYTKYRFVAGDTQYSSDEQFSGFSFGLGLSIIGFD